MGQRTGESRTRSSTLVRTDLGKDICVRAYLSRGVHLSTEKFVTAKFIVCNSTKPRKDEGREKSGGPYPTYVPLSTA